MAKRDTADFNTSLDGGDPRVGDWGLYRASYEKDSCGFGLIASLDDQASHWVLQTAISSLNRLTHRGAIAADGKTGDGCGLLIKQPTVFLRAAAAESGLKLKPLFAAGLVFLNQDPGLAAQARRILTEQLQLEKLQVAGFRALPVDRQACGSEALKTLPTINRGLVMRGATSMSPPSTANYLWRAGAPKNGWKPATRSSICRPCRQAPSSTRAW